MSKLLQLQQELDGRCKQPGSKINKVAFYSELGPFRVPTDSITITDFLIKDSSGYFLIHYLGHSLHLNNEQI